MSAESEIRVDRYGVGECDSCEKQTEVFVTGEAGCVFLCADCLATAKREMQLTPLENRQPEPDSHGLIYLASPYSHANAAIRHSRFETVCAVAAKMMQAGLCIFSPIAHTHPIACAGQLPTGWEFWRKYDHVMLSACARLYVLMMPGWQQSVGVKGEIEIMQELGKPIEYIDPEQWK